MNKTKEEFMDTEDNTPVKNHLGHFCLATSPRTFL